jgi:hypothetical protein
MQINRTLLLAVAFVAIYVWFGVRRASPGNGWLFILRVGLWLITLVLIYGPLADLRPVLGTAGYLACGLAIAGFLYWLGIFASNRLRKSQQ